MPRGLNPFSSPPDPRWTASSALSPCCHPPGATGKGDGGSGCAGGYARWLGTVRFGTGEDGRAAQGQPGWPISVRVLQVELAASSGAGLCGLTHGGGGQSGLCERGPGRAGWSWDPPATGDLFSRQETGLEPGRCPGAELDAALSLQEKRLFGGAGAGSIRLWALSALQTLLLLPLGFLALPMLYVALAKPDTSGTGLPSSFGSDAVFRRLRYTLSPLLELRARGLLPA
ncbi:Transmembrane protein 191C [Cricetulus griseus]|uniref:Transmembrane protein 191C n=1 Tax=Cricetulus griseus TaxID=10029 RepID=G3HFZ5_CRIGR|nr:Transmembrane protein 191C [Cricetulus griseus]